MAEEITGKKLGRNQLIGIVGASVPYVMNYALVWAGKLEGSAFWGSSWVYVSGALLVILGGAAYVKGQALKSLDK
jgi:hypothetical protein